MTIDALNACMVTASEIGVTLAIEDFGVAPTLQCSAAHCLEILEAVPGLAFVFDTGNFYFCHEDPLENVKVLGAKTRHVHLKDWVKSATPEIADVSGALLGSGLIPNEALIRGFLERGAVESFSLEAGAPGDKLEATRRDLETFRRWAAAQPERRAS
jgi:sugar phosphate isomerase/epimerase